MNESYLWKKLKLASSADMTRHEDKLNLGIPDVSYGLGQVNGWIELKALKRWPKDPKSVVPFRNLKIHQIRFLQNRGRAGGHCFLMVIVGRKDFDYLLFSWQKVRLLGKLTQEQLFEQATYWWRGDLASSSIDYYLSR